MVNTRLFIPLLLSVSISTAVAGSVTEVSRYTTVKNQASAAQINPLLMVVQVTFPRRVQTVGDAMEYLLRYSGYALQGKQTLSGDVTQMLKQPLPMVVRRVGPMTLQDALEVLAGKHVFKLIEDPLHRKVSFEVLPSIKSQMKKDNA